MDNLKKELAKVVVWIKSHGEESMDGKSYHFACKDEPYMHFTAEWQEWNDNKAVLYFGYHFEQNGDICYDPRFSFMIEGDQVTSISMMTANGKSYPATTAGDLDYASQFLQMAYKRHMEGREVIGLEAKEEEVLEGGREAYIDDMVATYRADLEEMSDEELLAEENFRLHWRAN